MICVVVNSAVDNTAILVSKRSPNSTLVEWILDFYTGYGKVTSTVCPRRSVWLDRSLWRPALAPCGELHMSRAANQSIVQIKATSAQTLK